jgi:hypothetical protein
MAVYRFRVRGGEERSIDFAKEAFRFTVQGVKVWIASEPPGQLSKPRWGVPEGHSFHHGASAVLQVSASPSLEGQTVRFVVERNDGAAWTVHATVEGVVRGGMAEAELHVPLPARPARLRFRPSLP